MDKFMYFFSIGLLLSSFIFISLLLIISILSLFKNKKYESFEPKATVIIPAYNEEKNIETCIESILNSDYPKEKIELIVVDDGSTDNTKEIIKKYKIKLIEQNHKGKVEALNNAIKKAKNEFIIIIDADTYIEKEFIKNILAPFSDKSIGAITGIIKVSNPNKIITSFQAIEYNIHNIIRHSFSQLFGNSVWFLGALACYRKEILKKIKFKKESLAEDILLAMDIKKQNYRTISIKNAYGYTKVPDTLKKLYQQRMRWWIGGLQSIIKNKGMLKLKYGFPIIFLFLNQIYWSIYSILYMPVLAYQFNYWLPYNTETILQLLIYTIRWFSLWGPFYVISLIPKYGISSFTFFGVMSGILTMIIILLGQFIFRNKLSFKKILAIIFYFPYTIALNIIILFSLIKMVSLKKRYFIK